MLGSSSLGAIITVADTKGNVKGYVQNPGVDIKKTATGEVLVGPFVGNGQFLVITDYGIGNPYNSMTPLISGEIGEDLAFYLTEANKRLQQSASMSFWTRKTRSRLLVVPSSSLAGSQGRRDCSL